ncbi:MAG: cytochrome d ubiquinol oxidase subunit II, partial [Actinobacteria bacterium]|nr:cytochrome d ubiquinol oxidase subunit II [Actinomycetota bacterium]
MGVTVGDVIAGFLLLAVAAYSTAGGTDFGAGIWTLLAGFFPRAGEARRLVDHAMAPVWEANNVWLVFAAVLTWTGFPILFQSAFASLYPLFAFALLGLVLRGAFFAFRKLAETPFQERTATLVFGASSILAPFCFATSLGAIASGRVGVGQPVVPVWQACLNPTSIMFGAVSLAATALSGASFLVGDARRYIPSQGAGAGTAGQTANLGVSSSAMVEYFRRRAIVAALATLVVGAAALAVLRTDSPTVFHGMTTGLGLAFALIAVAATLAVAVLLWRRLYLWYRVLTVVGVGSFVFAWGFGQSPYLLPGRLTIQHAVGAPEVQVTLLVISVVALVLVIPSLGLLYILDQRSDLES